MDKMEMSMEELAKICGGELDDSRKHSLEYLAFCYKKDGLTLEQFLDILYRPTPEVIEYVKRIWNNL